MAVSVKKSGNTAFVLEHINAADLQKLFLELTDNIQMKVLNDAFKKSGKVIIDTAKSNFKSTKKGFSKTNYSMFNKSFKSKALKKDVGMIFGMQHREGFKYRFLNFGTKERFTKSKKRFTGVIKASNFFTDAVTSKSGDAQSMLSNEIVLSLDRVVKKYEKNASK